MTRVYGLWPQAVDNPIYCPDCGAMVADTLVHDEFHAEHDKPTDRFLAPKSEAAASVERDEKAKDDSLDSWVERITAAVRYTGTGDHEDVRSILHDFDNRSAT